MGEKKLILLPFSLCYGIGAWLKNVVYNIGFARSIKYDNVLIIGVGNLSVGGTGKTPMVEYLIRNFSNSYNVAVLSRGYGRKTSRFKICKDTDNYREIGDEPLQYVLKFPHIHVAVDKNRPRGIKKIMEMFPDTQIIFLDDSFQYRKVRPHLSFLMTSYYNLYNHDYLLPAGTLREQRKNAKRADIIVVTKCEKVLSPILSRQIKDSLHINTHQTVLFSSVDFDEITPVPGSYAEKNPLNLSDKKYCTAICFSGIANDYLFVNEAKHLFNDIEVVKYNDHHEYTLEELQKIKKMYEDNYGNKKFILTTEKDMMRLMIPQFKDIIGKMPLYYLPISSFFHENGDNIITNKIENLLKEIKN